MNNIYQIIASLSLDFYIESISEESRKLVENVLDEDPYEVINEISLCIEEKLKPDIELVKKLENFYTKVLSKSIVENLFIDFDLHERNIEGVDFFIAFCNYVAKEETLSIVNNIIYKRRGH